MSAPQAATTLLETVRVRNGVAPLWPLHLERLHRSAAALGIAVGELERPAGGDQSGQVETTGLGEVNQAGDVPQCVGAPEKTARELLPSHGEHGGQRVGEWII